ncbi:hypothetical protein BKA93DRAFT_184789 [Sparassis latifolia]
MLAADFAGSYRTTKSRPGASSFKKEIEPIRREKPILPRDCLEAPRSSQADLDSQLSGYGLLLLSLRPVILCSARRDRQVYTLVSRYTVLHLAPTCFRSFSPPSSSSGECTRGRTVSGRFRANFLRRASSFHPPWKFFWVSRTFRRSDPGTPVVPLSISFVTFSSSQIIQIFAEETAKGFETV